jgi:hypothetical protein
VLIAHQANTSIELKDIVYLDDQFIDNFYRVYILHIINNNIYLYKPLIVLLTSIIILSRLFISIQNFVMIDSS